MKSLGIVSGADMIDQLPESASVEREAGDDPAANAAAPLDLGAGIDALRRLIGTVERSQPSDESDTEAEAVPVDSASDSGAEEAEARQ